MRKLMVLMMSLLVILALAACGSEDASSEEKKDEKKSEVKSETTSNETEKKEKEEKDQPKKIVMGFVPSQNSDKLADTVEPLADQLSKELGIPVEGKVMNSYSAVVEGMGSGQIHIGFLPAFAYVLANEKYGVEVLLKSERYGSDKYRAQYVVREGSDIQSLADLEGKTWAIPDITSTSGFLFPAAQIMDKFDVQDVQQGFFSQTIPAGGHDNAIITLLEGGADVATTFEDARSAVEGDYPEVHDQTRVLGYTDWIPNDTISANAELSNELVQKIESAFLSFNEDEDMLKVMKEVYSWDAIIDAKDEDYDIVRDTYQKFKDSINIDDM